MDQPEELGIIGETKEEGLPVIYKFVDELTNQETRDTLRWLTVFSWRYDRSIRNGMPPEDTNRQMLDLEHAVDELEERALCRHAYSRTGNGLKELVYYIADRDEFMAEFNNALRKQPGYPIDIKFYEDQAWEDFQKIRELFKRT